MAAIDGVETPMQRSKVGFLRLALNKENDDYEEENKIYRKKKVGQDAWK
jgi:hypothetical protein